MQWTLEEIRERLPSLSKFAKVFLIAAFVTFLVVAIAANNSTSFGLMPAPYFRGHKQHLEHELSKKARSVFYVLPKIMKYFMLFSVGLESRFWFL